MRDMYVQRHCRIRGTVKGLILVQQAAEKTKVTQSSPDDDIVSVPKVVTSEPVSTNCSSNNHPTVDNVSNWLILVYLLQL